jgi:predicted RNase H-like HicB family nuclease
MALEKIKVYCVVEKADEEYLAYCDELRATASGDTEEEALENLKIAIKELIDYYSHEQVFGTGKSGSYWK